jgi:hypothetical protein
MALVVIAVLVVAGPLPATAQTSAAGCPTGRGNAFPGSTPPAAGQSALLRPVVLVHGWTGRPMTGTAKQLRSALPERISTFTFDYQSWSARWAATPNVAACLADYVNAVAAAYAGKGGDGRVLVVAHSMGGIAIRYAMSGTVARPVTARTVPYVFTFDTPYEGSPFGGPNLLAGLKEIPQEIAHPLTLLAGSDGGLCLAGHHGVEPLPLPCGPVPAYFPAGLTLFEMGGDITVDRDVLGVRMYTVPIASDGIVSLHSSHGYLTSGPAATAPAGNVIVHSLTDSCTVGDSQILQTLTDAYFPEVEAIDYMTLRNLQDGGPVSPATKSVLLGATVAASCGHVQITTEPAAVAQIATAARTALNTLTPPVTALTRQYVALPAFGRGYDESGTYLQVGGRPGLEKVNAALREAALSDLHDNQASADQNLRDLGRPADGAHGSYSADPVDSATSANSIVVSTLADMEFLFPDGNDGGYWTSSTVLVPSGRPVTFDDLFTDKNAALRRIAAISIRHFTDAGDECIRGSLTDAFADISLSGLAPKPENYRAWSLTSAGLRLGFNQGQFSAEACGKQQMTIGWSSLRPVLSPTGTALVAALR